METSVFFLIALIAWLVWNIARRSQRNRQSRPAQAESRKTRTTYTLKSEQGNLIRMDEPTSRLFTYQDERKAFKARQPLWIRYQDKSGSITERIVEIYHPKNDEVLFTWCRMKQEPHTFARRNIQSWRLLPEQFQFDPIVAQYWEEEGTLDISEKLPWRRWLQQQPEKVANRYT